MISLGERPGPRGRGRRAGDRATSNPMIDTTNRNTALASALVDELRRCGAVRAFLSPGSRSSPLALALDREPGDRAPRDPRRARRGLRGPRLGDRDGSPAIVACTSGSAAANLHPAVVEADQAGVPMIVLTSDRPPELRGIGAGQTIDQIGLYGNAARWFCEVGTHDADDTGLLHMRSTACRAFGEATAGRGPVHLNLAWRDPLGPDPVPGDLTASDPLALEGRSEERPLTVPDHRARARSRTAGRPRRRGRRRRSRDHRRGPAHRPRPRRADRATGRRGRLPDPRRTHFAAPLRRP